MRVGFWGVRGSLATPEPEMLAVGGNTSCVAVDLPEAHLVLDAGTGIRALGRRLAAADPLPVHVLLTHLHLDHIQGLLFFLPLFEPGREVTIWGPRSRRGSLRTRLGRYLSTPLSPVELRELPANVEFRDCATGRWEIAGARLRAGAVLHRGPTLGYRIEYGGATLAYLPDHEPALSGSLERGRVEWLSGGELAAGADLLVHDGQYSAEEYRVTCGWGHSNVDDALRFGQRVGAGSLRIFHHDPAHDDATLARLEQRIRADASGIEVALAREGDAIELS